MGAALLGAGWPCSVAAARLQAYSDAEPQPSTTETGEQETVCCRAGKLPYFCGADAAGCQDQRGKRTCFRAASPLSLS